MYALNERGTLEKGEDITFHHYRKGYTSNIRAQHLYSLDEEENNSTTPLHRSVLLIPRAYSTSMLDEVKSSRNPKKTWL